MKGKHVIVTSPTSGVGREIALQLADLGAEVILACRDLQKGGQLSSEIESRTAYPVLSKPVARWQFVVGKFFGAAGINAITVGLLSILFFVARTATTSACWRSTPRPPA